MPTDTEIAWRLRISRAHAALEQVRVCYEAARLLPGAVALALLLDLLPDENRHDPL